MTSRSRLLSGIALLSCLTGSLPSMAQISRDAGEIVIIEDDGTLITPVSCTTNGRASVTVNYMGVTQNFYASHDNEYSFIVMFTNFNHTLLPDPVTGCEGANAFIQRVSNAIDGIGLTIFDNSSPWGSSDGVLGGFINMGNVQNRPADPDQRLPGNNDSMNSLFGQEVGHLWGAFVQFDTDPGSAVSASNDLLGRSQAHWSHFLHANSISAGVADTASSLEGNFWTLDQGVFTSSTQTDGFSELDLYLMGLIPHQAVSDFWYIDAPFNLSPNTITATSGPRAGTTAQGTQRFVSVLDVIDVEGDRVPAVADAPKVFRQVFVLFTQQGVNPSQADIDQVNVFRRAWSSYFATEVNDLGAVVTSLDDTRFVDASNSGAEDGSVDAPFDTLAEGLAAVPSGGHLAVSAGSYLPTLPQTLSTPVRIEAVRGPVRLGQ